MLKLSSQMNRSTVLPADMDRCKPLITDFIDVIEGLSDVHSVERYPDDVYRVILKKMGAFDYGIWVAYDLKLSRQEDGIVAESLPFDAADPWIGPDVLLAKYRSETRLSAQSEGTDLQHAVSIELNIPIPFVLKLVPGAVLQSAADAIVAQKMQSIHDEMLSRLLDRL